LPIEYVIMAQIPYADLDRIVGNFVAELSKYPGVQALQTDLRLNTPELRVDVNRDKLGDVRYSVATVGLTLQTMLGGRQVTRFKKDGEQYDVIVQVGATRSHAPERHQRHLRARARRQHGATANVVGVVEACRRSR